MEIEESGRLVPSVFLHVTNTKASVAPWQIMCRQLGSDVFWDLEFLRSPTFVTFILNIDALILRHLHFEYRDALKVVKFLVLAYKQEREILGEVLQ